MRIAKQSMTLTDKALGIDRRVIEGQPIPPDLEEQYEEAGGSFEDNDTMRQPSLVGGPVVKATQDTTVTIDTYGVPSERKIFAGENVPIDLQDAYREATGQAKPAEDATEPVEPAAAAVHAESSDVTPSPAQRSGRRPKG